MTNRNSFLGVDKFVWWVGVVEDVADDLGVGRCRVRIFGWHTQNKAQLATKELPWAHAMYPINNAQTFGVPNINDWVVGFFMDGDSGQFPIMMGVLPGMKNG